nr:hypothetical protein [uncultured Rhodopila sp.]
MLFYQPAMTLTLGRNRHVMPTEVGIRALFLFKQRRGLRAFARHDDTGGLPTGQSQHRLVFDKFSLCCIALPLLQ